MHADTVNVGQDISSANGKLTMNFDTLVALSANVDLTATGGDLELVGTSPGSGATITAQSPASLSAATGSLTLNNDVTVTRVADTDTFFKVYDCLWNFLAENTTNPLSRNFFEISRIRIRISFVEQAQCP